MWGPGLKARAPSGAAGSNPRSLRHDVHVRQIRLAAGVCKTSTLLGAGGSNPLTCTRVVRAFVESGATRRSISPPSLCERSSVRIVHRNRLRRLRIGRLPVEEYGASLNLLVAASFAGVRYVGLSDALSMH